MKKIIIILLTLFALVGCNGQELSNNQINKTNDDIQALDFNFLKLENKKKNIVYSPLSIKYCLSILKAGASGDSFKELDELLNSYNPKVYTNSENLSLANIVMVKDDLKDNVNDDFKKVIKDKYNAEIKLDSFDDPEDINKWIADNTFNMIKNYFDSFDAQLQFMIINALAVDMEWINKIQNFYIYSPDHEQYHAYIDDYSEDYCPILKFNGSEAKATKFVAIADKYNIIKDLGEDNIRKIVGDDLRKELNDSESFVYNDLSSWYKTDDIETIINIYLDKYVEEIAGNYGQYHQSTDFYYFIDDSIKVFAKDLKEYDNSQFQFLAIMPKNKELSSYIKAIDPKDINDIINNLKSPTYDDFEEGYITEIVGLFPTFSITYDLDLDNNLKELGVNSMFNSNNNFNKIVGNQDIFIETKHKSTFELSNDGIKASAVTSASGLGAAGGYDYIFDVPVKTIDLTFDKPFLFLLRNKETGEIWFVGTLYEGIKPSIILSVLADDIRIRKEPSLEAVKIASAHKYEILYGNGNIIQKDGYTWYELKDGGWIADKDNEWLSIYQR